MKIAHILPYSVKYPLELYNARHSWALQLAELQAQQGHEVTMYCNPHGQASGIEIRGIANPRGDKDTDNLATLQLAFSQNHDVYHSHFDDLHYKVGSLTDAPIVFTQHWWPKEETLALSRGYTGTNIWAVPPTKYMYEYDASNGISTKGHIYHGVDLSVFHGNPLRKNGRLLSIGRISPEKNLELSIAVAKEAGMGMDIIGKVTEKNQSYWDNLLPLIDGDQIRYLGIKTQRELVNYYGAAQAVLFPSDPREAFGLVAIEAQACGTPVIMARGGSRGELVQEGVTGYLCNTLGEYVEAVEQSTHINPNDCQQFAQRFDINSMVENYQKLYSELLG